MLGIKLSTLGLIREKFNFAPICFASQYLYIGLMIAKGRCTGLRLPVLLVCNIREHEVGEVILIGLAGL